jgi:hypothetical protein
MEVSAEQLKNQTKVRKVNAYVTPKKSKFYKITGANLRPAAKNSKIIPPSFISLDS